MALAEVSPYSRAVSAELAASTGPVASRATRIDTPERVVNAIHDALRRNMIRDDRIVLLGEDIEGPYGGAFKVTKNLSREFPGRGVCPQHPDQRVGDRRLGAMAWR